MHSAHPDSKLRRFIYISRSDPSLSEVELLEIWGHAEILHRRADLSGVLAFTGRHFVQVIEGAAAEVEALLSLIRSDSRHRDMHVLCDQAVESRRFDHWQRLVIDSLDLVDQIEEALGASQVDDCHAMQLLDRLVQEFPPHFSDTRL